MADIVSPEVRSRMMAGIRGKNTKPELGIRRALFARGFRYRLHSRNLPGKPDIVLPRYRAVVLIHGCYWHGHNCDLFRLPKSNRNFWLDKISGNRARDARKLKELRAAGWRVALVWECSIRGAGNNAIDRVAARLARWLQKSSSGKIEIRR